MKKLLLLALGLTFMAISTTVWADDYDRSRHNDRFEHRYEQQGERINRHLDVKGDRIEQHFDRKAGHAAQRGEYKKAASFKRKGERINHHLDRKGNRIEARFERKRSYAKSNRSHHHHRDDDKVWRRPHNGHVQIQHGPTGTWFEIAWLNG